MPWRLYSTGRRGVLYHGHYPTIIEARDKVLLSGMNEIAQAHALDHDTRRYHDTIDLLPQPFMRNEFEGRLVATLGDGHSEDRRMVLFITPVDEPEHMHIVMLRQIDDEITYLINDRVVQMYLGYMPWPRCKTCNRLCSKCDCAAGQQDEER